MRVLSIQSHVVSGYVGNKAATFPLQLLGYDVDAINTVQFSNHTGYGYTNGHKTSPDQLAAVFEGLEQNKLVRYDRILSGYTPSAQALEVVAQWIRQHPAVYLLDPVMGDIGTGLYVAPDVIPIYKGMLDLATIITPNQFELEILSGISISSFSDLERSLSLLHTSVPHIALSSIVLPDAMMARLDLPSPPSAYAELAQGAVITDSQLVCFASSESDTYAYALPAIEGYFSGVGDLFSALVLAHFKDSLHEAVSRALYGVQQILLRTHVASGSTSRSENEEGRAERMRSRELRIIQERDVLLETGTWPGKRVDWSSLSSHT